ncbi:hypothetical protein DXG01_008081 [Tephrocybe rancida]|nr:hypothetical protein DXG01_008081 [Tephrocybe rancida]
MRLLQPTAEEAEPALKSKTDSSRRGLRGGKSQMLDSPRTQQTTTGHDDQPANPCEDTAPRLDEDRLNNVIPDQDAELLKLNQVSTAVARLILSTEEWKKKQMTVEAMYIARREVLYGPSFDAGGATDWEESFRKEMLDRLSVGKGHRQALRAQE